MAELNPLRPIPVHQGQALIELQEKKKKTASPCAKDGLEISERTSASFGGPSRFVDLVREIGTLGPQFPTLAELNPEIRS